MPRSYTVEHQGAVIPFEAPDDASPEQLKTLAARALRAARPAVPFQRPVLEKRLIEPQQKLADQGSISAAPDTLESRINSKITGALDWLGLNEGHAQRLADKATSALNDLTPVGTAVEADKAKNSYQQGDYLGALGHGALTALGLVPEGGAAKAMFLGVLAKNADRAALGRAEQLAAKGVGRKQIWNDTGWFKGADDKWRFEVPDNEMTFKPYTLEDNRRFQNDTGLPLNEVISHPALESAYNTSGIRVHSDINSGYRGSWQDETGKLRLDTDFAPQTIRSTAAHELQHFVQGREGFARGGMIGTIPAHKVDPEIERMQQELADLHEEAALRADMRDPVTNRIQDEGQWFAVKREIDRLNAILADKLPDARYQGYRRLAGEVEARNVQTRLDMTPGQRREYAPWETEDVPRADQFVVWSGR